MSGDGSFGRETGRRRRTTRRRLMRASGIGLAAGVAGCSGGTRDDEVRFVGPDGQVELTIVYVEGTDTTETTAEYVGNAMEQIGFAVAFESVSFDRLLQQYVANEYVGADDPAWSAGPHNAGPREETASESDWDLMYGITFNTYPRTPAAIDAFWLERSPTNFYGYVPDADLDTRFDDFRETTDPDERRAIMAEIFGILSEDQPVNFLAMSDDISGYRSSVVGPVETFGGNWDSQTWYTDDGSGRYVGGAWRTGTPSDAETLYFPEISDGESADRVRLVLDGAYDVDENDAIRPRWLDIEDSGDAQVYVCTLRDNLEWGDGYGSMTAADWVFQIRNVHLSADVWNEETPPSTQTADWGAVENVTETGELEFQLELGQPNPDFPLEPVVWGAFCAPKALYEEYAPDADALRESLEFQELTFAGNLGPYTFERWERSAEFVTTRNDDYYLQEHADEMGDAWADAPYFDSYTYRVISEQSSRLQALRQGELTATGIPAERYRDFVDFDGVDVYEIPQPFLTIVAYNQRANGWTPLRTREVRQALSMAVDKRTVAEDIYRGLAEWTHTFQPRWSDWYDDSEVTPFGVDDSHDPERARDLLAAHAGEAYGYE